VLAVLAGGALAVPGFTLPLIPLTRFTLFVTALIVTALFVTALIVTALIVTALFVTALIVTGLAGARRPGNRPRDGGRSGGHTFAAGCARG
jgi:hypothetical protein